MQITKILTQYGGGAKLKTKIRGPLNVLYVHINEYFLNVFAPLQENSIRYREWLLSFLCPFMYWYLRYDWMPDLNRGYQKN